MTVLNRSFPFYRQMDTMDCGPTCLRMIAKQYGKMYSLSYLREKSYIDREGVSLRGLCEAAEHIGFRTLPVKVPYSGPKQTPSLLEATFPCVAHWDQNHFIVVYKANKDFVWVADPAKGKFKLKRKDFEASWLGNDQRGILLLLEPSAAFFDQEDQNSDQGGWSFLLRYMKPYRNLILQLLCGLLLASLFQLIFPFLTQAIVDIGIENQNLGFIYLILLAQLMLFGSQMVVRILQSWILLHIGTRINVNLVADFLVKLMRLPFRFFDAKMTGDLLQRIQDHRRIEMFLTQSALAAMLSVFNLVVFGLVLLFYHQLIFLVFLVAATSYVIWIFFFMKKRKEVDYLAFKQYADNQNSLIEIIQGMPEIKLQGSQLKRRWGWTTIQAKLFRTQMKALSITQYQDAGASFISQLKDIIISFIAAKAVIDGSMTLGMMLAVQYVIGQLNVPLLQLISFIRNGQDARISLERLGEIHREENESDEDDHKIKTIPPGDVHIKNLSFRYTPISPLVLRDIDCCIPRGKITAIVGTSGSGKTTLLKLLLGFYQATEGSIRLGRVGLNQIRQKDWRRQCGVVMQEGYIFSDTIANNIAESDNDVDQFRLLKAVNTANIQDFIESLPLSYHTMIGAKGNGISQGQRQRMLIARAVYKDPGFIFLDEATNALDAKNERVIMENLQAFFQGRTVVVVAHRLSTVKRADQIIVLDEGQIIERGNHRELIAEKGAYYRLIKDQLELGQ